ncbi:hypothetical protein Rt10032_c06g2912 [Rhodotorula toruloides]|uniref:Mediator of RNA polymerase II transcription subunit 31 n=1 Tax=Rhodotorula toruloides TaxID=5286 RepID=A0A511KG49_RHOTO|nr:hypothetical protein Rt10032_c06g2912 [Rhodotorula toruloides]
MASLASTPAAESTEQQRIANKIRFETELEFVSCLANPFYLQSLAQQGLFDSEPFLKCVLTMTSSRPPFFRH